MSTPAISARRSRIAPLQLTLTHDPVAKLCDGVRARAVSLKRMREIAEQDAVVLERLAEETAQHRARMVEFEARHALLAATQAERKARIAEHEKIDQIIEASVSATTFVKEHVTREDGTTVTMRSLR